MTFFDSHIASVFKGYLIVVFSLLLVFQQAEAIAETVQGEEIELVQNRTTLEAVRVEVRTNVDLVTESAVSKPILKRIGTLAECFKPSAPFYLFHRAMLL